MNVAGVILAIGPDPRIPGGTRRPRPRAGALASAARDAQLSEVVVVVDRPERASEVPDDVTVLLDAGNSQASALRAAVDWCTREGHDALVVMTLDVPLPGGDVALLASAWRKLATTSQGPLVVGTATNRHAGFFKIDADVWPVLPLDGAIVKALDSHIELLSELELASGDTETHGSDSLSQQQTTTETSPLIDESETAAPEDVERVKELIGRTPSGKFSVALRNAEGDPIVIRNAPFLDDNTPLPTRYWLVGKKEQEAVGRFESSGGVRLLESLIDPLEVADTHDRYAKERDALIDPKYHGPRPSGGVGGTRRGVKCLHAHLAWYLAGGGDPIGRYVAHHLSGEIAGRVGAIDCGTNSTRLLILDYDGSVLTRKMIITRLGEGVDDSQRLQPAAIERTVAALRTYREILDRFGVVRLRATSTSAARDAVNREEFFSMARDVLGVELELLSGEEEGRTSYLGATADITEAAGPYLVVDVGGGSTEFAAGGAESNTELVGVASLDMGCVRITERYLLSDPPTPAELLTASESVGAMCRELISQQPALAEPMTLVAVAGTVATLATLSQGLDSYDGASTNHTRIARSFVESQLERLARMSREERRHVAGIEKDRADVIVGGILVVQQVLEQFGFDELVYSENDSLDGVARQLLGS